MRRIILAALITCLAVGTAAAQSCDSKAVSANGKPLHGAAKMSFVKKCKRDACGSKAVSAEGKPLHGAAKNSFVRKCMRPPRAHGLCLSVGWVHPIPLERPICSSNAARRSFSVFLKPFREKNYFGPLGREGHIRPPLCFASHFPPQLGKMQVSEAHVGITC